MDKSSPPVRAGNVKAPPPTEDVAFLAVRSATSRRDDATLFRACQKRLRSWLEDIKICDGEWDFIVRG